MDNQSTKENNIQKFIGILKSKLQIKNTPGTRGTLWYVFVLVFFVIPILWHEIFFIQFANKTMSYSESSALGANNLWRIFFWFSALPIACHLLSLTKKGFKSVAIVLWLFLILGVGLLSKIYISNQNQVISRQSETKILPQPLPSYADSQGELDTNTLQQSTQLSDQAAPIATTNSAKQQQLDALLANANKECDKLNKANDDNTDKAIKQIKKDYASAGDSFVKDAINKVNKLHDKAEKDNKAFCQKQLDKIYASF